MTNASVKNLIKTWDTESKSYKYDSELQADYKANFYHILKCLGDVRNKKIIEVGSGSGQMSAYLASNGGMVHLVDISKKSLDFSKRYFLSKKLMVKTYQQDAFAMKFPKESFDIVWNGGVIEHFEDFKKIELINKMWKLVKPGGKLLIMVPNANDLPFMIAKRILELRKKWAFGKEDDLTKKRMTKLAMGAGINNFLIYAYNPVVGYWFFPYGREVTDFLKVNTVEFHKKISIFGHVLVFVAQK